MRVNQKLKLLFYRKTAKKNKKGYMPIYCRMTIDGISDEISTGCTVLFDDWDNENKLVKPTHPLQKAYNKKLRQMNTDLERHFDLVIANERSATPQKVFFSYQTPINGERLRQDKVELASFGIELDELVKDVVKHDRQVEKGQNDLAYYDAIMFQLRQEHHLLDTRLDTLIRQGTKIFEDKRREKTLCMAIEEFELDFLQHVMANVKAVNTLKKKYGTKRRIKEFIHQQYKKDDLALSAIEPRFIAEFVKRETTQYRSSHNTIWKYVQIINEIIDRAVAKGWITHNMFSTYKYAYEEPLEKSWPTLDEILLLTGYVFAEEHQELTAIRDIFIYQCFAGPSYAELYALQAKHLTNENGKIWVRQRRRKSRSAENLPLLPICLEIIEKYRDYPKCQGTGKLLPVPTGQHYNRCLKTIGEITGIPNLKNSHQARYFFANELAYAASNDLSLTGLLMGQRHPNSVRTYVKPTEKQIMDGMNLIEEKLYRDTGKLSINQLSKTSAKIIHINKEG